MLDPKNLTMQSIEDHAKKTLPKIDFEKIKIVTECAQNQFWREVAEHFPEVTSGDYSPMQTLQVDLWMQLAVIWWLQNNHPSTENS